MVSYVSQLSWDTVLYTSGREIHWSGSRRMLFLQPFSFGDTVNAASRMESHGEAGKIHISSSTARLLETLGNFFVAPVERSQSRYRDLKNLYKVASSVQNQGEELCACLTMIDIEHNFTIMHMFWRIIVFPFQGKGRMETFWLIAKTTLDWKVRLL